VARAQRGIERRRLGIGQLAGMEGERFHAEKLTAKERKEHKEFQGIAVFSDGLKPIQALQGRPAGR
jgi:hypothetical protein